MRRLLLGSLFVLASAILIVGASLFSFSSDTVRPAAAQVAVTVIGPLPPSQICLPMAPLPNSGTNPTFITPICPPPPLPPFPNGDGVLIRSYKVSAAVTDQIAVTQITLDFVNQGVRPAEIEGQSPLTGAL